jgi:hypothetical protein
MRTQTAPSCACALANYNAMPVPGTRWEQSIAPAFTLPLTKAKWQLCPLKAASASVAGQSVFGASPLLSTASVSEVPWNPCWQEARPASSCQCRSRFAVVLRTSIDSLMPVWLELGKHSRRSGVATATPIGRRWQCGTRAHKKLLRAAESIRRTRIRALLLSQARLTAISFNDSIESTTLHMISHQPTSDSRRNLFVQRVDDDRGHGSPGRYARAACAKRQRQREDAPRHRCGSVAHRPIDRTADGARGVRAAAGRQRQSAAEAAQGITTEPTR